VVVYFFGVLGEKRPRQSFLNNVQKIFDIFLIKGRLAGVRRFRVLGFPTLPPVLGVWGREKVKNNNKRRIHD